MSVTHVQSVYVANPGNAPSATSINGPCAVLALWFCGEEDETAQQAIVSLENGTTSEGLGSAVELFKWETGKYAGNAARGQRYIKFPGDGMRFDKGLWVVGEADGSGQLHSLTVFYRGANS